MTPLEQAKANLDKAIAIRDRFLIKIQEDELNLRNANLAVEMMEDAYAKAEVEHNA